MQHYMIEKNPDGVWVVIDAIGSRAATSSEIAVGEQIAALTKERDEAKADAHKSRDELEHVKHDCAEEMKNRAAQSAEQQQRIAALEKLQPSDVIVSEVPVWSGPSDLVVVPEVPFGTEEESDVTP